MDRKAKEYEDGAEIAAAKRRDLDMNAVAKLAGVSIATVSRALSNPQRVNAATRSRVLDIVRETGYTPNIAGRQLRAARSMSVLVVMPTIVTPFFAELFGSVDRALSAHGYSLLIGNLLDNADKEHRLVDLAFSGGVDGVILLNGYLPTTPERSLADSAVPMVAISVPSEIVDIPCVLVREREAASEVARHLLALGHRRFGYIAGPAGNHCEVERWRGFSETLLAAGIAVESILRLPGDFGSESGERAAALCLAAGPAKPTAVFAISDMMAIGFMRGLRAAGLDVPQDVSVAGFDGIMFTDYCEPPLTTVKQPIQPMGEAAAELLIRAIAGDVIAGEDRILHLSATLRISGSTAAPNGSTAPPEHAG